MMFRVLQSKSSSRVGIGLAVLILLVAGCTWSRTFGGFGYDQGFDVRVTPECGFVAVGYDQNTTTASRDLVLLGLDGSGDDEWVTHLGWFGDEFPESLIEGPAGGFVIAGSGQIDSNKLDALLVSTKGDGTPEWVRHYGGVEDDKAYDVIRSADGGYVLTGFTRSIDMPEGDYNDEQLWVILTRFRGHRDCAANAAQVWFSLRWSSPRRCDSTKRPRAPRARCRGMPR